jgi:hypothetical protein
MKRKFIVSDESLDGYTSPGGTVRIHKSLATLMLIAAAAEIPNKAVLKAKQGSYEQVMKQAEDLLDKQRKAYEEQCAKMAEEHQSCMEKVKKENDRMLEEAIRVR